MNDDGAFVRQFEQVNERRRSEKFEKRTQAKDIRLKLLSHLKRQRPGDIKLSIFTVISLFDVAIRVDSAFVSTEKFRVRTNSNVVDVTPPDVDGRPLHDAIKLHFFHSLYYYYFPSSSRFGLFLSI